ncbi:UNVERIFIED_CONTAM: hypothetical protein Sangu_2510700 [Sesamum angustifolium]|uniref:Transposase-associated domain-containing protein n=1 Tax=Sesamum angustifolium TaxID=2727405 RepID=A0AAW2JP33_9LAMI
MYEKNLPSRAGLTPKFKDGVTAFIQWAKSHHACMDCEKIKCPCRKCKNKVFKILDKEYFEAVTAPLLQDKQASVAPTEEGTNTHWGDAIDRLGVKDGCRCCRSASCCSVCCRATIVERLHLILIGVVAELVDIKGNCHISERIYDRTFWADHILPCDHTLPRNYYSTKKFMKDLGLPMEKIDAYKNGCMLYWKDNIDLEYCKFCGEVRYKSTRE